MNNWELNSKVANLLGWKTRREESQWIAGTILEFHIKPDGTEQASPPPDYCNDLNAMHEAEKALNPCRVRRDGTHPKGSERWGDYIHHLLKVVEFQDTSWPQATARQRAEAFVKTMSDNSVEKGNEKQ